MLDQEGAALDRRLPDPVELLARELEGAEMRALVGLGVREEQHGRRLLDERVGRGRVRDVGRGLRAEPDDAVQLPDRLQLVADEADEDRVVEEPPALVHEEHDGSAVEQLVDPVVDIHERGGADGRLAQDLRHVETEDAVPQIEFVLRIGEEPAALIRVDPVKEARGEIAGAGPRLALQEFQQEGRLPLRLRIGHQLGDGLADDLLLLGRKPLRVHGQAEVVHELEQELAVLRRIGDLERVEAGGFAGDERGVCAAERPDQDLAAPVLVEEDEPRPGRDPLRLAGQEPERDGLARPGRADHQEVAEVVDVEVEGVGRGGGRFQQRHRLAPVQPVAASRGVVVKGGEAAEVGRHDAGAARHVAEVGGQLRPEGELHPMVLAGRHHLHVGQRRADLVDAAVEFGWCSSEAEDREVMLAKRGQ